MLFSVKYKLICRTLHNDRNIIQQSAGKGAGTIDRVILLNDFLRVKLFSSRAPVSPLLSRSTRRRLLACPDYSKFLMIEEMIVASLFKIISVCSILFV